MKNFSILFFLPLLVFGQPIKRADNDLVLVEVQVEIVIHIEQRIGLYDHEPQGESLIVLANLNLPILDTEKSMTMAGDVTIRSIPKHLNTLSLSMRPLPIMKQSFAPQERLDSLLALNDKEFPKEDTLFKGLSAVRYTNYQFGGPENMPEGFGPKITL